MSPSASRIFVTGATGLIGINLVRRLAVGGHRIRILARNNSPLWPFEGLNIEVARGDITDINSLHHAIKGCETVFHLAGLVVVSPFVREWAERINVEGTRNILAACRRIPIKRLIHTSSIVAVGHGPKNNPATEDSEWNLKALHNPYYDTKRRAEDLVLESVSRDQIDAVVVNPSYVFGPYDVKPSSGHLIRLIAANRANLYPLGGINVVGVDDVVSGHISAWQRGRSGERYILGAENLSYRELMNMIADRFGTRHPSIPLHPAWTTLLGLSGDLLGRFWPKAFSDINSQFFRISRIGHYVSSAKAIRELGYQPHPIGEAIDAAIQWLRANKMLPAQELST